MSRLEPALGRPTDIGSMVRETTLRLGVVGLDDAVLTGVVWSERNESDESESSPAEDVAEEDTSPRWIRGCERVRLMMRADAL